MIHPDNVDTGNKIIDEYAHTRWVLLCAPMQSGKTSIYTYVAEQMIGSMVDRVYVISAMNDNFLRDQTIDRVDHVAKVYFLPALINKVKNGSTLSLVAEFSSSLIIIDESHIGAGHGGILHRFLSMIGVSPDGSIDMDLYPHGDEPYIMSVSATPYSEVANMGPHKRMVTHIPGPIYTGLDGLDIIPIDDTHDLPTILNQYKDTKTYAIIRDTSQDGDIENMIKDLGFPIIHCNMRTKLQVSDAVATRPDTFTIVMVKMYARCGYTFSNHHVSMVWESLKGTDGQAQGLPGRCCGYDPNMSTRIYCHQNIIDHINWVGGGFDPSMVPNPSNKDTMYSRPHIDIGYPMIMHIHEPANDEAIIPHIYGPLSLLVTVDGDDIDALVDDMIEKDEWSCRIPRSFNHLRDHIINRQQWGIPLYTPSSKVEMANLILDIIGPTHIHDIDNHPLVTHMWTYKDKLSQYLLVSMFPLDDDGIIH